MFSDTTPFTATTSTPSALRSCGRNCATVHASGRADPPRVEPPDGKGRLRKVGDVHPRAHDSAHEPAFQHAARAMLVAIHRDGRGELERGRVCGSETGDELRGEVDVDDAGHAEPAEERAPSLRSPDEARADHRPRLELLVRPDLHLSPYAGMIANDGVVADDAAFLEDHARLQCALSTDDGAVQLRVVADVRVAPDDGAIDHRADIHGDVVAQDGRSGDLDVRSDLHALAEKDRAGETRGFVDVDVARRPHARHELVPEALTFHLPAEEVGVRAPVLGDGTDIGPVTVGNVSEQGL